MSLDDRREIIDALSGFKNTEFSKVFDKWQFYYNSQAIMLTNIDEKWKKLSRASCLLK